LKDRLQETKISKNITPIRSIDIPSLIAIDLIHLFVINLVLILIKALWFDSTFDTILDLRDSDDN